VEQMTSVFLSSKIDGLEHVREFAGMVLQSMQLQVENYPDDAAGGSKGADLAAVQRSQLFVLLIRDEIPDRVRQELDEATRLGLPVIPLAMEVRTSNRRGREVSAAVAEYRKAFPKEFVASFKSLSDLERRLRLAVQWLIRTRMASKLRFEPWGPDVYDKTTSYVRLAEERLAVVQSTSSLILGPHRLRHVWEQHFEDAVWQALDIRAKKSALQVVYIFSAAETAEEVISHRADYPKLADVCARIDRIMALTATGTIKVVASRQQVQSALVADDSFGVSLVFGQRYYAFAQNFRAGANDLWEHLSHLPDSDALDAATFAREYGLT
jgi:hypothetical protein